jgi:hypothetical protein
MYLITNGIDDVIIIAIKKLMYTRLGYIIYLSLLMADW